jgi:serine/threonine-protein kinase
MAANAADRDLLFGLIALQNGLIDQDQLVNAFRAWTRDKARSLADHLQARGDLTVAKRALLDALAEVHLEAHDGDVEKSLAAVPANRSTRASLADLGEPEVDATLARVARGKNGHATERDDDPDRTAGLSLGGASGDGQRFRLLRPHARGGLGEVFVALDGELHREVALKQILEKHADDPVSRQRFVAEAEITGGLEHPGVVPVYGLGTYGGGRPYYAMRFIKGDSLKEAIEHFHGDDALKSNPGRRSLELRKLLRRFLDVCNAVDYAHSRGVIHRDIKPSNIILGKHGETLVVDWGLAKVVGRTDPSVGELTIAPTSRGSSETLPGSALGTPAYMSPEQAAGDIDHLGPPSDVYSLGASLYCLLTGKPPFEGDVGEVLRAVQRGAFPVPRRLDPSVDAALEAVCVKSMANKPEDRYASCRALAEDVERWSADEPVTAWREPLRARVGRKLRRYKTFIAAAAVVLVSVTAVSSVLTVRIYREKTRVELAEKSAVHEKLKAEEAEKVAIAQSHLAIDALGNMVHEVQDELQDAPGAFLVRQNILNKALALLTRLNVMPATSDRVIRRHLLAHMQVGDIAWSLGDRDKAHAEYSMALQMAESAFRMNPASDKAKGNLGAMHSKVGESEQWHFGRLDAARQHFEWALKAWTELAEKMRMFPGGDPGLDEQERLNFPETEQALADAYDHVGRLCYADEDAAKRDAAKAEELLQKSLEIRKRHLAAKPSRERLYRIGVSYWYLADNALKNNDIARTVMYNEELLKVRQALLKDRPTSLKAKRDVADGLLRLGNALWYAGQHRRAYLMYQASLEWNEQVMWSEPDILYYRGRVCQSHYCIGCGALDTGDRKLASHHFREALKLREATYLEYKEKNILDIPVRSTLMLTLARCGEHRRAAELAEEVRPRANPRVLAEEIGTTYGICMAAIQGDRTPDQLSPEERTLRDHYRELALASIKEGAAKGYNVVLFLEGDPDMEPLLALPEFRAWLAEFKKGLKLK